MKKAQVPMIACLAFALLSTAGVKAYANSPSDKPTIKVFVNDHLVNTKDSLEITAKGTLRLTGIANQSEQMELVKFRIQIRHAITLGSWQMMPFVEEYQGGKSFATLDLEELLSKVKPGDQIVLIPVEDNTKYENGGKPILLNVSFDRC